jgi:hypothetical protein
MTVSWSLPVCHLQNCMDGSTHHQPCKAHATTSLGAVIPLASERTDTHRRSRSECRVTRARIDLIRRVGQQVVGSGQCDLDPHSDVWRHTQHELGNANTSGCLRHPLVSLFVCCRYSKTILLSSPTTTTTTTTTTTPLHSSLPSLHTCAIVGTQLAK